MGRFLYFIAVPIAILALLIAWYVRDDFEWETVRGKRVLVCGASTGIGEAIAYQYARFDAKLVLVARRKEVLQKVAARCLELGAQQADYVVADLSTLEAAQVMVKEAVQLLSGVDIVVLNHIVGYYDRWTADSDLTKVPNHFAVNTISYINIATLCLPELQKSSGSIIVASSFVGIVSIPRVAPYSAAKHALHGFFDSMRQDLYLEGHHNISVTLCVIGPVDTPNARKRTHDTGASQVTWYPTDECALAIIKGGSLRRRQIYYPYFLVYLEMAHFFFPTYIEDVIQILSKERNL